MAASFPRHRQDCRKRVLQGFGLVASGLCLSVVVGCGLPTWTELMGGSKEDNEPKFVPPPPKPQPATPPTPPPPPPPNPADVVGKFQKLKPFQIDDESLGSLLSLDEGLDGITELDLKGSPVTSAGLGRIGKLTHLAKLDLRSSKVQKDAFAAVAEVASLEELRFEGSKVDDAAMEALRPLANLKVLDLQGARLTRAGFAEMLHHRQIVELNLRNSSMDDLSLDIVSDLPDLERLGLGGTQITDAGLARLAKLDRLVTLDLQDCPVSGRGFAPIAKNKGLQSMRELNLANTRLDEQGAAAIKLMKQVRILNLAYLNTMQDAHLFNMIRTLTELESLILSHCPALTSNSMQAVRNHKTLERVDLSYCPRVDDAVFNHLVTCKNLKHVNLQDTNCTVANAQRFLRQMPGCEVVGLPGL